MPFNLVPTTTVTAGVDWTLPVPDAFGTFKLGADYYHSSKVSSSDAILPAYDLVNARLDVEGIAGSSIDAAFFMRNVFDKEYVSGCQSAASCAYGEGRSGLLKAHFSF